jgi:hypothetical protein
VRKKTPAEAGVFLFRSLQRLPRLLLAALPVGQVRARKRDGAFDQRGIGVLDQDDDPVLSLPGNAACRASLLNDWTETMK